MRINLGLFLLFLLLSSHFAFAQVNSNELDNLYTPSNSSVLNSANSSSSSSYSTDRPSYCFKISPFIIARGIASLQFEKKVNDFFALKAGLGYNFANDMFLRIGLSGPYSTDTEESSIYLSTIFDETDVIRKSSVYLSASAKFYFEGGSWYTASLTDLIFSSLDWDESYIELNFRYQRNSFVLPALSFNLAADQPYSFNNNMFNFIYGHSYSTSGKVKTTHEVYTGFGLRFLNYKNFEYNGVYNVLTEKSGQFFSPSILLGYNFGIGW